MQRPTDRQSEHQNLLAAQMTERLTSHAVHHQTTTNVTYFRMSTLTEYRPTPTRVRAKQCSSCRKTARGSSEFCSLRLEGLIAGLRLLGRRQPVAQRFSCVLKSPGSLFCYACIQLQKSLNLATSQPLQGQK